MSQEHLEHSHKTHGNEAIEPLKPPSILQVSTVAYSIMTTIGVLVSMYVHDQFFEITSLSPGDGWRHIAIVIGLATGVLMISGFLFEEWFPNFKSVRSDILRVLGPTPWYAAFYLALLSSFGEEFLFRAALQPFAGIFVTSIVFGLMHLGPDGRVSTWTLWAFIAGILLGLIFESTANIWPVIAIHFLVNLISILRLQRDYRALSASQEPAVTETDET